jgi:hypothetical protein
MRIIVKRNILPISSKKRHPSGSCFFCFWRFTPLAGFPGLRIRKHVPAVSQSSGACAAAGPAVSGLDPAGVFRVHMPHACHASPTGESCLLFEEAVSLCSNSNCSVRPCPFAWPAVTSARYRVSGSICCSRSQGWQRLQQK